MSSPPKPWERAGINQQNYDSSDVFSNEMSGSLTRPPLDTRGAQPTPSSTVPPPLPARPQQYGTGMSGYGGYGSYGGYSTLGRSYGGYGGYGGGIYGGGMYGGLGGAYGGYSPYGQPPDGFAPNSFAHQAEESSRQAFQSIESIVQAFGSVAMMLESTFAAVTNSFRAVVGVADHFTRMRLHFTQIFSALAIFRSLRWLYRKLLILLRLRPRGVEEELWKEALAEEGASVLLQGAGGKSSWPIILFLGIVFGGPWLIWRLLSSFASPKGQGKEWANGNDDHFVAQAEYTFNAEQDSELSFQRGQKINLAPKELQPRVRGWLLASVDGEKTGLVPANYVKILGKRPGRKQPAANKPQVMPPAPQSLPHSVSLPSIPATSNSVPPSSNELDTTFNKLTSDDNAFDGMFATSDVKTQQSDKDTTEGGQSSAGGSE